VFCVLWEVGLKGNPSIEKEDDCKNCDKKVVRKVVPANTLLGFEGVSVIFI